MSGRQLPIQEGLYTWPSERPQLIASRCKACGEVTFPKQDSCPGCTGRNAEEIRRHAPSVGHDRLVLHRHIVLSLDPDGT